MKILCVWLYDYNSISYEQVHYFQALQDLGHTVKILPLDNTSDGMLLDIIDNWDPKIAIFKLYPNKLRAETIHYITKETCTTTLVINGDDERQFDVGKSWDSVHMSPNFDYIITTCRKAIKWYRNEGLKNVIYSQYGCNHKYCKKISKKKNIDVLFLGSRKFNREDMLNYLKINEIDLRVYGRGWDTRGLNSDEYVLATNQAKINLNSQIDIITKDNEKLKKTLQIKGRDFEVPMCGSFLLTDYNEDLKEFYKFGKEIETYKDYKECLSKIKYYLKHEDKREKIALAGHKRALKDHTYVKRFKNILNQVDLKC